MGPQPTMPEADEEYRTSPDRVLRDLKERIRQGTPLRWSDQTNDRESDVMGEPVMTEPQEGLKTGSSSVRREATTRRSPEYKRRETRADRRRDDWRENPRDSYWRDRDRDRAPPRRVFDSQMGESHPLPYESKDRYIITHKVSKPPTFKGYGITEYLEKWELHASRSQWSEEEIVENFLFNVDPSLGKEVKEARPKDGRWITYKKNLAELYKLEDNKYSIKDLETMTQDEDESVRAFGKRFQKISDVLMKKGKISEVERCTIFIGHLSKGRQKSVLRDLPRDKLDFPGVLKLAIKAETDDYKDLVWRGMRRRDFSLYKEYATDRCPDFKDYTWTKKHEAVTEEVKEIRDMVKGFTRQVTEIVTTTGATTYRNKPGESYSLRWDRRNTDSWRSVEDKNSRTLTDYRTRERERDDEPWRHRDDDIDRDRRARETYGRARRLDDYSRSPRYEADGGRSEPRGRWESDRERRDGYRDDGYERTDRDGYRSSRYDRGDRDGDRRDDSRGWYDRDRDGDRRDDSRGWYDRGGFPREQRDDSRGWYNRGDRRDESRGDTTLETAETIHEDDMGKEDLEETAAMIRAAGMREGDTGTEGLARRMCELGDWMITHAALDMRLMGVRANHEVDGSRTGTNETDTRTTDMRGQTEMDTGAADMTEEIETETDEMTRAAGMTAGDSRENSATTRGGGTTEEIDAMSHAGDTTLETAETIHEDDMGKEDLEETAAIIRDDHIKRDCPDLKRAIDEGLVVLDNCKYVKWANDLGDVSMFPSMKENVEARRVKPSKGKDPVRSQSIKITFEGDMATTPIRVAATKSTRGSTSKKTDTYYVMAENDGQRIDGEEVILSPRKGGVKKFLMKSSLDEIDTVEPLRWALRQPIQCSILEYLAASKPARDELQMITRKTRIPLSEEVQMAPKADAPTVAVSEVTARADRMATVLLDGMEGVPLDKYYILGSGTVEAILNDKAVLDDVIDNDSEAVIIDEDLAEQVGLGLDRSYLFEIETADGRKQQITEVCHKAAIEVQGVRVILPVFAVKNCSSNLLLGRTWLSHVHAVTIERPDGSQTLSIKKLDGTRVMIETVEPRDPRNRAALAVEAGPSDRIKSLPISGRAVRFREKKYGPLLSEEEGRIVEVEDLGMQFLKEEFKEGGKILGVSFFEDETDRPFIVSTDAGPCSVGGLLSQKDADGKERPLRFESRTLNTAESNYSQFKKEVLAVLRCLDTFRHYIYGRRFILRVDPTTVASVLQKDFSLTDPTIARSVIRIRLYDYTVERISEAKNTVADGLSRIPIEAERLISVAALTMAEPRRTDRFLVNLYGGKYRAIGLHLSGEENSDLDIRGQATQYCLSAGHLFHRPVGAGMPLRVNCDPEEKQFIVAELHDDIVGGHRGVKGTYEKVHRLYWWEGQYKDVEKYCETCEDCQKRSLIRYKESLHPSYPTRPGEKVHIDLVKMPKGVGNMNYVVNIRDDFTGFVDGKPIRTKAAREVKNFVLEYLSRYGCVSKIVMDRGAEFLADEVQSVFKKAGARVSIATAYHPQSNAPVERGHQSLIASLSKWCRGKDSD
ncbi:hypothetical protein CBR_g3696 [Chara braunii]|uniref:Integrase catalytic domain-containing protein n=1 Tax=Chara braunii TaxID=69332 RepID=A0A388KG64_CHABU|nr:hypothetical protein CBR_g3696 [Chara braunii]|eukprot:GBG68997.1 hypothetical protein CBR_g3696 [Chara braunii]